MKEFDQLLNIENDTYESSKEKGINDGKRLGYVEGYQLGFDKGTELGQEIGYYQSCVTVWNHLVSNFNGTHKFSTRGIQNLEKLTKLLQDYHLDFNDENIMSTLSDIRMKFKLTSAQLGLQTKENDELSF
ncbi:hypothetical protein DICPUDRAFT_146682 [Dictyostelium purpureum]|uniref:Essential protein Yae1 N-terminal domain-containing protein n=1 Tax=Dictyostelium purpureum TaxID=5786 RepID=F0Z6L5_DICPU|nr:uncharacterized protein DICPUDRAFT_146682 [Dictyostelium purpureum]EGC40516.1 hypothetical protein DICPUDRAFT_146682 [Dictyostelium purpureum]|eukprot:XP_003283063.1 hypothetical protein DICPUDRAFT_146682 [Dictyostelium purpureum]